MTRARVAELLRCPCARIETNYYEHCVTFHIPRNNHANFRGTIDVAVAFDPEARDIYITAGKVVEAHFFKGMNNLWQGRTLRA